MSDAARDVIQRYYAAFNAHDDQGMLRLLTEDVVHDLNQGGRETGRDAFRAFLQRMARCYREQLTDLVIMNTADGARGACEYVVHGTYLQADAGLPPAHGQRYVLPGGAFFTLRGGMIARVTNYYDLPAWLAQVRC